MLRTPLPEPRAGVAPFFVVLGAIAALYFAQDVFLPLAIAALLSFVLTPVSSWLERHRLNRGIASILTVVLAFTVLSGVAWVVGDQLIGLMHDLPRYKDTLKARIRPLHGELGAGIDQTARTVK